MDNALTLTGVTKRFGKHVAVDDLSLAIPRGKRDVRRPLPPPALLGRSGALLPSSRFHHEGVDLIDAGPPAPLPGARIAGPFWWAVDHHLGAGPFRASRRSGR